MNLQYHPSLVPPCSRALQQFLVKYMDFRATTTAYGHTYTKLSQYFPLFAVHQAACTLRSLSKTNSGDASKFRSVELHSRASSRRTEPSPPMSYRTRPVWTSAPRPTPRSSGTSPSSSSLGLLRLHPECHSRRPGPGRRPHPLPGASPACCSQRRPRRFRDPSRPPGGGRSNTGPIPTGNPRGPSDGRRGISVPSRVAGTRLSGRTHGTRRPTRRLPRRRGR
mmetsp:Transcript_17719/g.51583  ORF Transcript_17719/g.51583 Transcript_17719/m.51583 type:complete len:222 (-) Transcript_17719:242-907(-)